MINYRLNKVLLSEHSVTSDPLTIRSFILSDRVKVPEDLSQGDSFIFDGIVIALCTKGSGSVKINFREFDLVSGSILTILPNQVFNIEQRSEDLLLEALFFSFELPVFKNFDILFNLNKSPCLSVSKEKMQDLLEFHSFIMQECRRAAQYSHEKIIRNLLYSLVLKFGSVYYKDEDIPARKSSRQEELTYKFFNLLMQYYKQERNVSFYAGKLCLTIKYLSLTIKKITRHSILEWINEAVMIEAKTQLKMTDRTVLQISEALNFPTPSVFCRFFKSYAGTTPHQFRNKKAEN